jgi:hypothetical protein
MFLGVLPWVTRPQPWVLRHREFGGVWAAPATLSQLSAHAYQLEAGRGRSRVHMFIGCHRRDVTVNLG